MTTLQMMSAAVQQMKKGRMSIGEGEWYEEQRITLAQWKAA